MYKMDEKVKEKKIVYGNRKIFTIWVFPPGFSTDGIKENQIFFLVHSRRRSRGSNLTFISHNQSTYFILVLSSFSLGFVHDLDLVTFFISISTIHIFILHTIVFYVT